ncbi:hypothetical protein HPB48_017653 [Haemaphysalis longicornis]|uniref:Uncharacterized protein n=1 Tax=Haemaphysalis longicornis TaxID=44386 RepID=A0A9J6GY59_HAELO|nr:hypothetical protein HPB48_017653 [Haemaphysalis longicornis]
MTALRLEQIFKASLRLSGDRGTAALSPYPAQAAAVPHKDNRNNTPDFVHVGRGPTHIGALSPTHISTPGDKKATPQSFSRLIRREALCSVPASDKPQRDAAMAASLLRSLLSAVPLALLIAMCQSAQGSRYCPSKEIIYPCGCTQTRLGPRVLCTAVNNEQTLRTVLAYLSSYKLNAFTLRHINFTTTPDLFSGLRAVTVKIQDSVFRMHNSNSLRPFAVAGDVQDLDVRESFLDLGNSNLAVMHGLKYVTVRASSIGLLQKRWFDGMEGLNKLTIESTRLGGLEDNALAGLTEVEDISLVADTLEHLRRSYFPEHATRLTRLDFR